ncbi:MAG: fibronectin-binding protein (FBP) [Flammeovirgaceae bacterium]|nr:fibronectin-binding protein (FBP) [Flammeovirgaceae bacterium]HCX21988.1 fibronectin-binding protein (FBP) [Cytophagales bacterium]|tara:strand:- start:8448 stop:9773 length:1326 start_codon:yes stop_codon:yes gene_type:complete
MEFFGIDWTKKHILKTNTKLVCTSEDDEVKPAELRQEVEPWLSAIFQSEHLSVLIGSGLTSSVSFLAGVKPQEMWRLTLDHDLSEKIKEKADESAEEMNRGEANIEDDIRITLELINGLRIIDDERATTLGTELNFKLKDFISSILSTEKDFFEKLSKEESGAVKAFNLLKSFILSFASRSASRERLNVFTTNYDRFIELACDETGVLLLDRFKGKIQPIFRNTRLELDYHYNPPGIRGEPRYAEGVSRITKLHGSIDWCFQKDKIIKTLLPFGADNSHPSIPENITDQVVIYPNSSKDLETAFYPYAELFRDFSSSICQPNSVIITYGYGFGDSHINRVIEDMLTIPSTHLVIIAWDRDYSKEDEKTNYGSGRERIIKFLDDKNSAQCTLLIGEHFGDLENLVEHYLPKSAIDRLTVKMQKIKDNRGQDKTIEGEDEQKP